MRAGTYKVFLLVAFAAALCSGLVHAQGRLLRGEPGKGIEFEERPSRYEARLDGDNLTTGSVAPGATDYALVFDAAGNPVKVLWTVVFSGIEGLTPPTPVPTVTPQPTPTPLAFPGEEGQVLVSDGEGGVEANPVTVNADGDIGTAGIIDAGKFQTGGGSANGGSEIDGPDISASGTVSGTTVTATNWVGLPESDVPDPIVPADGTQNITGNLAVSGAVSATTATLGGKVYPLAIPGDNYQVITSDGAGGLLAGTSFKCDNLGRVYANLYTGMTSTGHNVRFSIGNTTRKFSFEATGGKSSELSAWGEWKCTSITLRQGIRSELGGHFDGQTWWDVSTFPAKTNLSDFMPANAWAELDAMRVKRFQYKRANPDYQKWLDPKGDVVVSTETLAVLNTDAEHDAANATEPDAIAKAAGLVSARKTLIDSGYRKDARVRLEQADGRDRVGFIAEELHAVNPALTSPDGKGVSATAIAAHNTAALQEAKRRIEALEAQVAAQAAVIEAMEARLKAIETGKAVNR